MTQHRFSGRLMTLAYCLSLLLIAVYTLWLYAMGEYQQLLLTAFVMLIMLATLLLHLGQGLQAYSPRVLALGCTFLLVIFALHQRPETSILWVGLPITATFLLLPLWAAFIISLGMIPVWYWLPLGSQLGWDTAWGYLTLVLLLALPRGEHVRRRALLRATDPNDSECDAYHIDTLNERLRSEYQRAAMLNQQLAVLVIHLPQLDMAGEQFGNRARLALLEALCTDVYGGCREHDILGRAGPTTFWLVLPDTSESGALLVRERLQRSLSQRVLVETGQLEVRIAACLPSRQELFARYLKRLQARADALTELI
ncbi:diguanylate cyclase [Vreelandella rituensis]|uniref:Diguanylate cyclase n=1 Tax=Vreelandella rituensis TaxID=2282306 RepID=A0A368TY33_9GAMM|nr:diguanylate cyclase [Halomonas rituensis]RCV88782.1 diguanylate cyclase [Halomonas rituensis]